MANIPPLLPRRADPRVAPTSRAMVSSRQQRRGRQGQQDAEDPEQRDLLVDAADEHQQAGAHKAIGALTRAPASPLQHEGDGPIEDDDVAHFAQGLMGAEQDDPGAVPQPAEQEQIAKRT